MKENRGFLSDLPRWLWFVSVVSLLIILILPAILTLPGYVDFSNTGEIGDTIGGIMNPFIAIIAAFLTFFAFWVQLEANKNQRNDISIERQEAKFYKMLDIYSEMTKNLEVHGIKGKEAFADLVGEFTYTFFTIDMIFETILSNAEYLNNAQPQVKTIIQNFIANKKDRYAFITIFSYNLFFYGKHYMIVDFNHPERTALGEEIKKIAFSMNKYSSAISFVDYVKAGNFEVPMLNNRVKPLLFVGHSDFLGHYFRHLFQMVKYVSSLDCSLFDEVEKSGYVKMLRAQMSDYEQILLYYNSLTEQGNAWNKKRGERFPEDTGYIARFRLIKNLPPNFPMFGILPQLLYKDDSQKWEKQGKRFYEHVKLPINRRAEDII